MHTNIVIKWLLVEWEDRSGLMPHYGLVNVRSLINRGVELHTGKLVIVANTNGPPKRAKIVMASDDKRFLEQQFSLMEEHAQQIEAAAVACEVAYSWQRTPQPPLPVPANIPQVSQVQPAHHLISQPYSTSPSSWSDSDYEQNRNHANVLKKNNQSYVPTPKPRGNPTNVPKQYKSKTLHKVYQQQTPQSTPVYYQNFYQQSPDVQPTRVSHYTPPQGNSVITFYDQGTQTGLRFDGKGTEIVPKVEEKVALLEAVIDEMEEKMAILEGTIDSWTAAQVFNNNKHPYENAEASRLNDDNTTVNKFSGKNNKNQSQVQIDHNIPIVDRSFKRENANNNSDEDSERSEIINNSEMVSIGTGKTLVPRHIINQIDWNSYTMATRKLLMALFPRRTLATHSLTGKSSPAFMNRPAKLSLDPIKVNDIVLTVTANCGVKDSLVRSAITTKCADENKMFRIREEKNIDQENMPPSPHLPEKITH